MYRSDDECNSFGNLAPKVEGFSLRRNTWKKIGNAAVPRLASQEDWAFVEGNVYWLEAKRPGDYPESMWILSFDFNDEVFGEVECPAKFQDWVGREANVTLMEFKGSVSLCVFGLNQENGVSQRCCVWVMRHEGGAVSWTKQFKVELKERFGWPLTFTKSGKLIIASADSDFMLKDLVSCDLKSLQFKDLGNDVPSAVHVAFIESLVLLGGGTVLSRHSK